MSTDLDSRPHWVYEFMAADGSALYIGCTANIGQRIAQHSGDKPWFGDVASIEVHKYPNRTEALAAEHELHDQAQPLHAGTMTERANSEQARKRQARMDARDRAHAARELCNYSSNCRVCVALAHERHLRCSYGCTYCKGYMPREYISDEVSATCWQELRRRHCGEYANRLVDFSPTAIDALAADEAGITADDLEAEERDRWEAMELGIRCRPGSGSTADRLLSSERVS